MRAGRVGHEGGDLSAHGHQDGHDGRDGRTGDTGRAGDTGRGPHDTPDGPTGPTSDAGHTSDAGPRNVDVAALVQLRARHPEAIAEAAVRRPRPAPPRRHRAS